MTISVTRDDDLSTRLDSMIGALPKLVRNYDVRQLLASSEDGINPRLMSIGPYYHGEGHLQHMEYWKLSYLKLLLQRRKEPSAAKYVVAMKSLEEKAREYYRCARCYRELLVDSISSDKFVEMMVVDGVFIVEFLRKLRFHELRGSDDPLFDTYRAIKSDNYYNRLVHDLLFRNNQVPLFIIDCLFTMTKDEDGRGSSSSNNNILDLTKYLAETIYPWSERPQWNTENVSVDDSDHLLALVYKIWCCSFKLTDEKKTGSIVAVKSVSELQRAGIKFMKNTEVKDGLKIQFADGVMKIPSIRISSETEVILLDLILYENYASEKLDCKYVSEYAYFMRRIAASPEDVKRLRQHGIVTNLLESDKAAVHMFQTLCAITKIPEYLCYADVYNELDEYCVANTRMSNLRNYCCLN